MENEDRHIEELLNDLIQRPSYEFPKKGSTKAVGVPPSPGVASALGMLVSDLRHHYRATVLQPLAAIL